MSGIATRRNIGTLRMLCVDLDVTSVRDVAIVGKGQRLLPCCPTLALGCLDRGREMQLPLCIHLVDEGVVGAIGGCCNRRRNLQDWFGRDLGDC